MVKAVIFDMDGLLIDSEPFWQAAEKEIFKQVGIDLTPEMCSQTVGLRIDEVVEHWYHRFPWDINSVRLEKIRDEVIDGVIELIRSAGQPMPGVANVFEMLQSKEVKLALASSSSMRIIEAVLAKLALRPAFKVVHSAEFEGYGKPHPAVFLSTAKQLGVSPLDCLVLEDSLFGVLAAKAARMRCLAVPDARQADDPRFAIADIVLPSLEAFDEQLWQRLNNAK